MRYIVSISGGAGSAVAADRAITRYGRHNVILWFADTKWESADLYRFINDCMQRWGGRLYTYTDGRTPLQVAEDRRVIPNSLIAPCAFELKIKPFRAWLWRQPKPVTVLYGLDWSEPHRIAQRRFYHRKSGKARAPVGTARLMHGVYEDYPLLWKPLEFRPYADVVRSWGIEPPAAYAEGFSHNNCGGRCVKQGISEWRRLKAARPADFDAVAAWELAMQSTLDTTRTILKSRTNGETTPLRLIDLDPLHEFAATQDDLFSCVCGV